MKINFYKGDLPASFKASNIIALDSETMGLNPKRDKLCLVQISNGDEVCHLVKIDLSTGKPINLIKILTVENQTNKNIYNQFFRLFELLNEENWIKKFIFWELEIIKIVGYDINFNDYVSNIQSKDKQSYVFTFDGSKKIPTFLLKKDDSKIDNNELKDGLKIVGDFLNKSVLIPSNINYPPSRTEFTKLI